MSYLDQTQDFRRRATAITGAAAIHAAIGLGLVAGLTVVGVAPPVDTWNPFTITPEAKPTPPPPKPVENTETQDSFVVVPTPAIDIIVDDPVELVTVDDAVENRVIVDPGPRVEPVIEPRVTPTLTPRKARPTNGPLGWISTDDYPARALRSEAEGIAAYRLIVGTNGRVSACEVTRSTGNGLLDEATCKFIIRRARFEPATDEAGAKVVGNYAGTVKWDIPE